MTDFLSKHSITARVALVYILALLGYVVFHACQHVEDMGGPFAAFAGGIVGLPAVAIGFVQWSRERSKQRDS